MSSHRNSPKGGGQPQGPLYLPLHQDRYTEALSTGIVPLVGIKAVPLARLDAGLMDCKAHGFDYGVVGLLELAKPPANAGYLLLSACTAFWLRDQGEADELEAKLELFDDTVPDALAMRVDANLFAMEPMAIGPTGELDLGPAATLPDAPASQPDAGRAGIASMVASLAGAASMVRHRCLECSLGIEVLAGLLDRAPEPAPGRDAAASLALGVMGGLLRGVAKDARATNDELLVISEASGLIAGMDPAEGIEPLAFGSRLHEKVAGAGGEGAAAIVATFRETIAKLSDNQLELTTARIDDSGQIGLRALMVFLLAPKPEQAVRWASARKDIGIGVSILASMFSGLYAGLGSVPRRIKAPDKSAFLATIAYAQSLMDDGPGIAIGHHWSPDGAEHHVILVGGAPFAATEARPTATASALLESSRSAGLLANVDAGSGAITIGRPGDDPTKAAVATTGNSRWLASAHVATLGLHLRHPGKGQCPRNLLEQLLAPGLAPAWAALGEGPGQVILSVEAMLQGSSPAGIKEALALLHSKADELGLCFPAKAAGKKRAPRKKAKAEGSDGTARGPEGAPGNEPG